MQQAPCNEGPYNKHRDTEKNESYRRRRKDNNIAVELGRTPRISGGGRGSQERKFCRKLL